MTSLLPLSNAQLTAAETESIRKALGGTASPLCFGICRILVSTSLSQGWQETNQWGAACLVMDRARNSKILRVFNIQTQDIILDEELYIGMQYLAMKKYFHAFEAQGAVIGFDFTNEEDAANFYNRVSSMIPTPTQMPAPSSASPSSSGKLLDKVFGMFSKKEKEMQIGSPSNVVHKHHIGIDPKKGFEIKNIPDEWKALFKASGVKPSDLKDFNTANMLFNTISSHYRSAQQGSQRPIVDPQATFINPASRPLPPTAPLGAPPPPPHQQPGFNPGPSLPLAPSELGQPVRKTRRAPVRGPPPQPLGVSDRSGRTPPLPPPARRPPLPAFTDYGDQEQSFAERYSGNVDDYQQPSYSGNVDDQQPSDSGNVDDQQPSYERAPSIEVAVPPPPPPPLVLSRPSPPVLKLTPPSSSAESASTPTFKTSAANTPNARSDLLSQIQAGKLLRPVSSPTSTNETRHINQALPDLSSMRDSEKMDMISHIKTLLDARRDHIEHNDESDEDDDWD